MTSFFTDPICADVASVRSVRLELYRLADRAASKLSACRTVLCDADRALMEKYLIDDFCNRDPAWSTFIFVFRHANAVAVLSRQPKRKLELGDVSPTGLLHVSERSTTPTQGSSKRRRAPVEDEDQYLHGDSHNATNLPTPPSSQVNPRSLGAEVVKTNGRPAIARRMSFRTLN